MGNPIQEVRLSKPALFAAAEEQTGLSDWGDTGGFEPPLDKFLESLNSEARLNPAGRFNAWGSILGRLSQRLLLQQAGYGQVPLAIADKPAFAIFGPPRTGTTLLQRLLALDPEADSLRFADVSVPVPATFPGSMEDDAKVEKVTERLARLYDFIPDLIKIHEMGPRTPDEELFLMDYTFMTILEPLRERVPTYWRWIMQSGDHDRLYRELKHLFAFAGQHRTGSRWVLKTPHHLWMLPQLMKYFPNAQLIWVHRDPANFVLSAASLSRALRTPTSDETRNEDIGQEWVEFLEDGVSRAMACRAANPNRRIHDVQYKDLVRDPAGTVAQIYAAFGMELPESMPQAITHYLAVNPKGKHGRHGYSAEEFGLREEAIREQFSGYIEAYNVQI